MNGTVTLSFTAPNVTEPLTLFVLVNSSYQGTNVTTNLSEAIEIVQPYRFNANLQVGSQAGVSPFYLTVTLDGAPVGSVKVPSLSAGASYPISFPYVVPGGLSPGWHTFSMNLASEHGLVTFAGGVTSYSSSFYVPGPPENDTPVLSAGDHRFHRGHSYIHPPGRRAPARPQEEVSALGPSMATPERRCTSCGMALSGRGATQFGCPDCGDATLGRDRPVPGPVGPLQVPEVRVHRTVGAPWARSPFSSG